MLTDAEIRYVASLFAGIDSRLQEKKHESVEDLKLFALTEFERSRLERISNKLTSKTDLSNDDLRDAVKVITGRDVKLKLRLKQNKQYKTITDDTKKELENIETIRSKLINMIKE